MNRWLRAALLGAVLLLSACGDATPAPTPSPTVGQVQATETPAAAAEATEVTTGEQETATPEVKGDDAQPGEETATPGGPAQGDTGGGAMVADLGFRPAANGFKFENYGAAEGLTNLTPDDLRRMFGDQVCASTADNGCILTPPAEQWMVNTNEAMGGGHCEGFAALSLVFYTQKESPTRFGGDKTYDLDIAGNQALQREIAYFFATQATLPTQQSEVKGKTPNEILDMLTEAFKTGSQGGDTYTMGIYQPGFKGGHAITPYAVQDKGNGVFSVMVYDNNYPGLERSVEIDRNANTWVYTASTNPNEPASEYKGDADTQTLTITPTSPRLEKQVCNFCDEVAGGSSGARLQAPATQYNEIWVDGDGHLLITTPDGKRLGYVDGNLVNEIPGASFQTVRSDDLWKDTEEPVYYIPTGIEFTVTLDGDGLEGQSDSSVTMIGPGYDLGVDNILLDPGEQDTITFSADGKTISYQTEYNESPDIILGVETDAADYEFYSKGVDIESGAVMTLGIDVAKGTLSLSTKGNKEDGIYELDMNRIDDEGEQAFGHDDISLAPDSTALLEFGKWTGNGGEIPLSIDEGSDGTIDDTISLTDE
jgi:hypothetical protein